MNENMMIDKETEPLIIVLVIIYILLMVMGISGNSFVIYLVLTSQKLRNVRNAFMLNLTFSNLLLLTICTPSYLLTITVKEWNHSDVWCKLSNSIQIVFVLVCAFSIMMIAIDRWICVVNVHSRQLGPGHTKLTILGLWLVAILLASPTFYFRGTEQLVKPFMWQMLLQNVTNHSNILPPAPAISSMISKFENKLYCVEKWPEPAYKQLYILVLFFLEFVLPSVTLLFTYISIIRFLKAQDDRMNHYEVLRKRLIKKERPHQRNCKLLSALCITFIVCYLPLSLFNISVEFNLQNMISSGEKVLYSPLTILTLIEVLNSVLSPILYGWMNKNFRNEIREKYQFMKREYESNRDLEHLSKASRDKSMTLKILKPSLAGLSPTKN
nr:G protein-coupled receptor [Proales similis]